MSAGSSDRTMFGDWWLDLFRGRWAHLIFLLELARFANRDGEVRVSALTIARRMGTTERHVFAYRKAAISAGALTEVRREGRQKVYRLNYAIPASGGHVRDGHASNRHADEASSNPANEQLRTLPTAVQENGTKNGSMNGTAAARAQKSELRDAWARESRSAYPGVHHWDAFVAAKIRDGEMPTRTQQPEPEDDFLRSIREIERLSGGSTPQKRLSSSTQATITRLRAREQR